MELTNRDVVGRAFELLAYGLEPCVESHLKRVAPGGMDWPDWLHQKWSRRDPRKPVRRTDPATLLRAIGEDRTWKYFKDTLPSTAQSDAKELRDWRNDWAHNNSMFTEASTFRLLDIAEHLLRDTGANFEADQIRKLRRVHQQAVIDVPEQYAPQQSHGHQGTATTASPRVPAPTLPSREKPRGRYGFGSAATTAGLLASLLIVMSTAGLIILSSAAIWEKVLIAGSGSALSAAILTASGVWPIPRRFTVTAVAAGLAAACGGAVPVIGTHAGRQIPSAGRSAPGPSTTSSRSIPAPAPSGESQMLVDLLDNHGRSDAPQIKTREFQGLLYRYSLAYPNLTRGETITYRLPPSYRFFTTLIGISGQAGSVRHVAFTVFGIRSDGSQDRLAARAVKLPDDPEQITVKISGCIGLILKTVPNGAGENPTAVWATPRLTSSSLHGRIFPNRH